MYRQSKIHFHNTKGHDSLKTTICRKVKSSIFPYSGHRIGSEGFRALGRDAIRMFIRRDINRCLMMTREMEQPMPSGMILFTPCWCFFVLFCFRCCFPYTLFIHYLRVIARRRHVGFNEWNNWEGCLESREWFVFNQARCWDFISLLIFFIYFFLSFSLYLVLSMYLFIYNFMSKSIYPPFDCLYFYHFINLSIHL